MLPLLRPKFTLYQIGFSCVPRSDIWDAQKCEAPVADFRKGLT